MSNIQVVLLLFCCAVAVFGARSYKYKVQLLLNICNALLQLFADIPPSDVDSRVVGGVDALPGQIPYIASLRRRANGNHFCGSSIIRPRWVLSAAHCTEDFEPADMFVVVGSILLSSGGVEHEVSQIINHPEYSRDLLTADISLVQVQSDFTFNAAVQPILVGSEYVSEANAVVSGWGLTNVRAKDQF